MRPRANRAVALAAGLLGVLACEPVAETAAWEDDVCDEPSLSVPLPDDLEESSGVAASRDYPGVFWTHNDSGWDPVVFAIDSTGTILARVRVEGAHNRDWEDIEIAPCTPGQPQDCLFIGDIGDNNERHQRIAVFRIPEPNPWTDSVSAPATAIRVTYPDGPRDAEALFVTDRGIHIVNKGRSHAIDLFRISPPYRTGRITELTHLQRLAPPPTSVSAQVTAAAASADHRRVILRTYGGLQFFEVEGDTLVPLGRPSGLVAPDQGQGEGADFLGGGRFVLTSEAQGGQPASLAIVRCDPMREHPDANGAESEPPVY
jgi:hypothetical protein